MGGGERRRKGLGAAHAGKRGRGGSRGARRGGGAVTAALPRPREVTVPVGGLKGA